MNIRQFHLAALRNFYAKNPRWFRHGYAPQDVARFAAWWRWQVRGI